MMFKPETGLTNCARHPADLKRPSVAAREIDEIVELAAVQVRGKGPGGESAGLSQCSGPPHA